MWYKKQSLAIGVTLIYHRRAEFIFLQWLPVTPSHPSLSFYLTINKNLFLDCVRTKSVIETYYQKNPYTYAYMYIYTFMIYKSQLAKYKFSFPQNVV